MWSSKRSSAADFIPYFAAMRADHKRRRGRMSDEEIATKLRGLGGGPKARV